MSINMEKYSYGLGWGGLYQPVHTNSIDFPAWKEFIDNNNIDEDLHTLYEVFKLKKLKINKPCRSEKYVFITIQTFQQKLKDLDKYKQFINNIKYLYSEGHFCLESGSVPPPNCNLHLHMLVKIIQPKKHKYKLDLEFRKIFDMSLYDKDYYLLKQWSESPKMPPYDQWVNEKLTYFDDEKKGSHANSVDLNCRGSWGVI